MLNRSAQNLEPYPFEKAYLNQMNNEARYYLNGKGIVRRDDGTLLFFIVEDSDVEFFDFGGTILDEYLTELTYMDPNEVKQLDVLRSLDEKLFEKFGLHVVSVVYAESVLKDVVIIEPDTKAYFQLDLMEIDNIGSNTTEELQTYEECSLIEPYQISIAEDGSIIVKE